MNAGRPQVQFNVEIPTVNAGRPQVQFNSENSTENVVRSRNASIPTPSATNIGNSRQVMGVSNTFETRSLNGGARLIGSTQLSPPKTTPNANRNEKASNRKTPNSALSKNSPVVPATVAAHQQQKDQSTGNGNSKSMDAIKEKMEVYLNACNDKILKKPERSPHASFLSYLSSKMDNIPKERVPALEKEILDVVFRFSDEA